MGFVSHGILHQIYLKRSAIYSLLFRTDLGRCVTPLHWSRGLHLQREKDVWSKIRDVPHEGGGILPLLCWRWAWPGEQGLHLEQTGLCLGRASPALQRAYSWKAANTACLQFPGNSIGTSFPGAGLLSGLEWQKHSDKWQLLMQNAIAQLRVTSKHRSLWDPLTGKQN